MSMTSHICSIVYSLLVWTVESFKQTLKARFFFLIFVDCTSEYIIQNNFLRLIASLVSTTFYKKIKGHRDGFALNHNEAESKVIIQWTLGHKGQRFQFTMRFSSAKIVVDILKILWFFFNFIFIFLLVFLIIFYCLRLRSETKI